MARKFKKGRRGAYRNFALKQIDLEVAQNQAEVIKKMFGVDSQEYKDALRTLKKARRRTQTGKQG